MRPKTISDEDLLRIACRCFVEHGPQVSTTTIALEAGVSQATLFKRFKTKELLMAAALMHESPILLQHLTAPDPDTCIQAQLRDLGHFMLKVFRNIIPRFMVLASRGSGSPSDLLGGENGPPAQARKAITEWFTAAQDNGQLKQFDAESFAVAFIGMLHARPFREIILGDTTLKRTDEEYVNSMIQVLYSGIAPEDTK
jgi:AcrR family transcriptional regulator